MKSKLTLFSLVALLAVAPGAHRALADFVIVQNTEGSGQSGQQTVMIKGDQIRTDMPQSISLIVNAQSGDTVTLMHAQKSFMHITADQTKAMVEQMKKMMPAQEAPKLEDTGKREKIVAYDCEIYTSHFAGMNISYWIAKDYPHYQQLLAEMEKMQSGSLSTMMKGMMPDMKSFPGMAVKTEMDMAGQKVTTTLVSAEEKEVDPKVFEIPKSYSEMAMPTPGSFAKPGKPAAEQ